MSAITIDNNLVHYEVLGRGRPVIFVHGWLGSWRYWVPTMQPLSMKYRTYALDLWGFGDSGKDPSIYGLNDQVQLLYNFFERLGIPKAAMIGHSLGAAVCTLFARKYPERAHRLMLINTPLYDMGGLDERIATPTATPAPATTPPGTGPLPNRPLSTEAPLPSTAPQYSTTSETIPRNPFRNRGETPEEILARLKAKNSSTTAGQPGAPEQPFTPSIPGPIPPPARPPAPVLPTGIATPILPGAQPQPSEPTPVAPAPSARSGDQSNPLVSLLGNIKPSALLAKYVDKAMPDFEALRAEVEKTDERVLVRTAQSFGSVNLALELRRAATPSLLLHGENDDFIIPPSVELLRQINVGKPAGHFLPLIEPALRHFPMLEANAKFNRLLLDFLEAPDLTNVQFKDTWKRIIR